MNFIKNHIQIWEQRKDIIWHMVVMHHPIFIQSDREINDIPALVDWLLPLLKDSKTDLILAGHEHLQMFSVYNKTGNAGEE